MTVKYFAILTNLGAAKLANATALGTQIHITQMAVGDGNGSLPTPDPAQTQLVNQKRIGAVNTLTVDAADTNQIIAEQVIPENEGGYWIRELGLFDSDGVLIAVANCPETYKPLLGEGSGRTQTIRMALIVSSTAAITLKIDPSVVLATRKYVDDKVIEVKAYADNLLSQHIAASNPHTQYAPIASPTLTGTPKAPTAGQTANDTQLATTEFVKTAISTLNLGDGSALPVGVPIPWSSATPPTGWLKCNGAAFNAAQYPKLAVAYPGLTLPDLRGEFIRGWDDGRGVDTGRAVMSTQGDAIRNIRAGLVAYTVGASGSVVTPTGASGSFSITNSGNNNVNTPVVQSSVPVTNYGLLFDASLTVPTAVENRPRNVTFNYIVRAA
ncbi:Phage Tail Collar Domain [Kosakonia arachidis]|uniref:Phage Tail Collar Domain n=1 Tax=Kosakonia arachidis TaxID=551989 RepID=A0A1I7E5V8_9ENTR|nr:phage tail protein [Kosakonia arachidis]SFU19285.1 Phage Tail Collar Domain [Kosakonia arachidis]